jgi:hypothetical protein
MYVLFALTLKYKFQYVITDLSIGSIVKGKLNQAQWKYTFFSPMSEFISLHCRVSSGTSLPRCCLTSHPQESQ